MDKLLGKEYRIWILIWLSVCFAWLVYASWRNGMNWFDNLTSNAAAILAATVIISLTGLIFRRRVIFKSFRRADGKTNAVPELSRKYPERFNHPLLEDKKKAELINGYDANFKYYFEMMHKDAKLRPLLDYIISFENYPDIFDALFAKNKSLDDWLGLPFVKQKEDVDKIHKNPAYEKRLDKY